MAENAWGDVLELVGRHRAFFDGEGDVFVAAAPGRLDVMGGIADYSGSVVLELPLDRRATVLVQRRSELRLRLRSLQADSEGLDALTETDLGALLACGDYDAARSLLGQEPGAAWAAYLGGAYYVLQAERVRTSWPGGASILLDSDVPLGGGVASSAAIEVAAMKAIDAAYGIGLEGLELARLCQIVENRVVGAPCGIMDQVTAALGREGQLLALKCQPHEVLGFHALPEGCRAVGINSRVKHAVGGGRYRRARVGAFMGLTIIQQRVGDDAFGGYLCNITPQQFRREFHPLLPAKILGADFLSRYGETYDRVTTVRPDEAYSVRACTAHPIYEHARVLHFAELMHEAEGKRRERALTAAGRLMYASHWSYGKLCALGSRETDVLVRAVRRRGPERGLYGAKITGGGSGGTVAVLADEGADEAIREVVAEYVSATGVQLTHDDVMAGSSPGAVALGHLCVPL